MRCIGMRHLRKPSSCLYTASVVLARTKTRPTTEGFHRVFGTGGSRRLGTLTPVDAVPRRFLSGPRLPTLPRSPSSSSPSSSSSSPSPSPPASRRLHSPLPLLDRNGSLFRSTVTATRIGDWNSSLLRHPGTPKAVNATRQLGPMTIHCCQSQTPLFAMHLHLTQGTSISTQPLSLSQPGKAAQ
ncbi:hypothetical protein GQ43DRAFT_209441 [Delitschia confertaspora ATCC 74209]|uniref:Uncharacterized protein n=1 Tax=Delitschia confertaspora ATCC 74209 TaxID=1513339 RepID=A0A9P4JG67_9PLEO|nr:hypothetical protein GQ43DRAFT_209441 [Delitschia confertaspora ATCC 74209]